MAKVGVVAVPYIKVEHHYGMAIHTMTSFQKMDLSRHQIDTIAISNAMITTPAQEAFFKRFFNVWLDSDKNILARAWNRGIELALQRGNEYVLVINLDLSFHSQFLNRIVDFAASSSNIVLWSGDSWNQQETLESAPLVCGSRHAAYYCCYLVNAELFRKVGPFDENFAPAYHEDCDMSYRIKLAGLEERTVEDARFFHFDRVTLQGFTIDNVTSELDSTRVAMNQSMAYYAQKWGGLPGKETFTVPFRSAL